MKIATQKGGIDNIELVTRLMSYETSFYISISSLRKNELNEIG